MPSRVREYLPAFDELTPEFWEKFVSDIDSRLTKLEETEISWENATSRLEELGLARINEALLPAYADIQSAADLGALLRSSSTSSTVLGTGVKNLLISEELRQRFAPSAHLSVFSESDNTAAMYCTLTDYNKETGVLTLNCLRFSGDGTYSDWIITPSAPMDLDHESLTTNPHSVTAAQVGLGNVDNTSDNDKPVSSVQQSELNLKQNSLGFVPVNKSGDSDVHYLSFAQSQGIRFPHVNQTNNDDGKIVAGAHDFGLNIIGVRTESNVGDRAIRFWGDCTFDGHIRSSGQPHSSWVMSCALAKVTSIKSNVGGNATLQPASAGFSGNYVRFTAPVDGVYQLCVVVGNASVSSDLLISLYGSYSTAMNPMAMPSGEIIDLRNVSNIQESHCFSLGFYLNEGDYLEPDVYRLLNNYIDNTANMTASVTLIA